MYNSLIFINFISRSKKVKPKSKSGRKHLFTVNKLLRLWYFVSVLNLKFLDQLERRHCKDTPFFRPFYIRAPKGPFLWGLNPHGSALKLDKICTKKLPKFLDNVCFYTQTSRCRLWYQLCAAQPAPCTRGGSGAAHRRQPPILTFL